MLFILCSLFACDKDKTPLPEPGIFYEEGCEENSEDAYLGTTTASIDGDGDGYIDATHTKTFDEYGNMLTEIYDEDDYDYNFTTTFTYDQNNNLLSEFIDYSDTGDNLKSWTYDSNGNKITEEYDVDNDGEVEWNTTWTYNNENNPLTETVDHLDDFYDRTMAWAYDVEGRLESVVLEHVEANSVFNYTRTFRYDANNNLVQEDFTYHNEGFADFIITWTYDDSGNPLTKNNSDPSHGYRFDWSYDNSSNKLTEDYDSNQEDEDDDSYSKSWTYDANDYMLTEVCNFEVDEENLDYTESWSYDERGYLLTNNIDFMSNGMGEGDAYIVYTHTFLCP